MLCARIFAAVNIENDYSKDEFEDYACIKNHNQKCSVKKGLKLWLTYADFNGFLAMSERLIIIVEKILRF